MNTNQVLVKDWHPAQVKAALEMAGTNLSQLARQHKYKHINEVLNRPWAAAELIVAKALHKKPEEIWPSRYERSRDRAKAMTRNPQVLRTNKAFGSAYAKG
ncbi:helix-turn-helix domain-containing protein [Rhodoferax sp. OV413]|uniref:helix-turn-helix domain-containing protein n=1 Tax=Rhodoferax sp. OV413 TaxID=1855285 RepID=UPI000B81C1A3|nr:helix-turn-helix domain-containing protein [Rhodoferax sp. OV413]